MSDQLLRGLPLPELQTVQARLTDAEFPRGAELIAQGERAAALYIVRSGVLAVDVTRPSGEIAHIASLIAGDCAGEMSLLTGEPASATISALVDTQVMVLEQADFLDVIGKCPTLLRNLSVVLSRRLAAFNRGHRFGVANLMRVRVHPSIDSRVPEALAAAVARHLALPLLVLDHRSVSSWDSVEQLPDLDGLIGNRSALERLRPGRPSGVLIAPVAAIDMEVWTRFERGLPDYISHILIIRPSGTSAPPSLSLGGARGTGLTLWPASERTIPEHIQDAVLVVDAPADNSRRSLDRLSDDYRARIIRAFAPGAPDAGDHIGWLARHLAHLKVGIALGGGGARGFSHLGVLRGLQRNQIPVDYITGCSIGAIVASCFAHGYDIDTIADMMVESTPHLVKLTVPRTSLLSRSRWEKYFRGRSGEVRMDELGIPCAVVASDILQRRQVVLDRGPAWKAVLASAAIPGIYPPVWIDGHCLFDGALLDPVPAAATRSLGADLVIAVSLMGTSDRTPITHISENGRADGRSPHLLDVLMRSFDLVVGELSARTAEGADVTLIPTVEALGIREFARGRTMVPAGEDALQRGWPQVSGLLPWLAESDYIAPEP